MENYESTKKSKLLANKNTVNITYLVLAIQLPTGATELITNTNNIKEKFDYIDGAYDDNLFLKANKEVRIVDWLVA